MEPPCRVLIADDNRDSADALALLLQLQGHETTTVYDGLEAVKRARESGADVVIVDLTMPDMDGFEVARSIRLLPQCQDALILACTGWDRESDYRDANQSGFDALLPKPLDFSLLLQWFAQAKRPANN